MASHIHTNTNTHTLAFISAKSNPRACCRLRQRPNLHQERSSSALRSTKTAHIYDFTKIAIGYLHVTS
jgi:hypothetical protein